MKVRSCGHMSVSACNIDFDVSYEYKATGIIVVKL